MRGCGSIAKDVLKAHETFSELVGVDDGGGGRTIRVFIHTFTSEELAEYDADRGLSIYSRFSRGTRICA